MRKETFTKFITCIKPSPLFITGTEQALEDVDTFMNWAGGFVKLDHKMLTEDPKTICKKIMQIEPFYMLIPEDKISEYKNAVNDIALLDRSMKIHIE